MERVHEDEQRDRGLFMNTHTVMLFIDPATTMRGARRQAAGLGLRRRMVVRGAGQRIA